MKKRSVRGALALTAGLLMLAGEVMPVCAEGTDAYETEYEEESEAALEAEEAEEAKEEAEEDVEEDVKAVEEESTEEAEEAGAETASDAAEKEEVYDADTAGDTSWQEDFEYELGEWYGRMDDDGNAFEVIYLRGNYTGTKTELKIPAKAVIDGKEYITLLEDFSLNNTEVKSISFEKGVILENSIGCFKDCTALESVDLSGLDTSGVYSFFRMFEGCSSLKEINLSGIDTSKAVGLQSMFKGCSSLTKLDVSGFDTSNVGEFSYMFAGCSSLTELNVSGFDTTKATHMYGMFDGCSSLTNLDISGFDTSHVTDLSHMFKDCSNLTKLNVSGFNTSKAESIRGMFDGCSSLTELDVSGFDLSKNKELKYMFRGCSSLKRLDVSGFNTSNVTEWWDVFRGCNSLTELDVSGFDTSKVTDFSNMFSGCSSLTKLDVSGFDTSAATNMGSMFYECSSLEKLDVSGFKTSKVTNMAGMFDRCNKLKTVDVSSFDTANVTNLNGMFYLCESLESINVSNFDTSKVEDMAYLFGDCKSLKELDVKNFNTSAAKRLDGMFVGCDSIEKLDVSGFDTSNTECMYLMFGCKVTELDVSGFNTGKLKYIGYLFNSCKNLKSLDLSKWDLGAVAEYNEKDPYWTEKKHFFAGCESLETIKTPLNLSANYAIPLPGKYVDASGNKYTELPHSDKSITLTRSGGYIPIDGGSVTPQPEGGDILLDGVKAASLKAAFKSMKTEKDYVLELGSDAKEEVNLTIPKTAKSVTIKGNGHSIEITGTKLTSNAPLILENVRFIAKTKKNQPAKFTVFAKKGLTVKENVSFESAAVLVKSGAEIDLYGELAADTVNCKKLILEDASVLKAIPNSKITVKDSIEARGGDIELEEGFNKPIVLNGTVSLGEGIDNILITGTKQADGTQILKTSAKKLSADQLKSSFDVSDITENAGDTHLYYLSSGKACIFGETITVGEGKYGLWKDAVAAVNTAVKSGNKNPVIRIDGDVNIKGKFLLPKKGYETLTIEGSGTITFTGDIRLTGNTVIAEGITLNKVDKKGNKVSGKVNKGKYTYTGAEKF